MERFGVFVLLLLVGAAAGLPALGARDFWPPDESRYGGVVQELARGEHHPLVPHLNGVLYPDKPAGYFLAIHASSALTGELDEAAARLPSVVGGAVLAAIVAAWVCSVSSVSAGICAGAVLLGFYLFTWQMRYVQMDMIVAAATGLMMAAFWRTWRGGSVWWCTAGWIALFVGVAIKGPIAPIGVIAVVVWALLTGRPRAFFNLGTAVGLVIVAAGVGGALLYIRGLPEGEEYVSTLLGQHVVDRARSGLAHEKPWYAYLYILPGSLLPMTPLLLLAVSRRVREAVVERSRPLLRFSVLWAIVFFVVLSVVPGKRSIYLLPAFPAIAMVAALLVDGAVRAGGRSVGRFASAVAVVVALVALTSIVLGASSGAMERVYDALQERLERVAFDPRTDAFQQALVRSGIIGLIPAVIAIGLAAIRLQRASLVICAFSVAATFAGNCAFVMPHLDPTQSRRAVADAVRAIETERGSVGDVRFFYHLDEGVPFYLGRPVPEFPGRGDGQKRLEPGVEGEQARARSALEAALAPTGALVVSRLKDLDRFGLVADRDYREAARVRVARRIFVVVEAVR